MLPSARAVTRWKNKHVQSRDLFLSTLTAVFKHSKWFGIPTYGSRIALFSAIIMLLLLMAIVASSIWILIITLSGFVNYNSDNRGVTARLSGAIFYTNGFLSQILCWKLIFSWKHLCAHWEKVETTCLPLTPDQKIRPRVIFVTSLVAVCAIVEHTMSMISATGFNIPPGEYFERYILSSHGFLLNVDSYSLWTAIPVFILSKLATALWNFQDLINILISMGLTSRYHRLNLYVHRMVKVERRQDIKLTGTQKLIKGHIWRRLREAYVRQAELVRLIDGHLGALILLSNINNFYFICLQLFLGLQKGERGLVNRIYYFTSLGWLLFRACSVVLSAADVRLHSRRALSHLIDCPEAAYSVEIKRLKNQLTYDHVALSGMGLFSLDRQTLLEVAANIIKYELVLIQYDK